jgi:cytochrome c-type biogenesis protein CcmF
VNFLARSGILKSIHAYSNQASQIFFAALLASLTAICLLIFLWVFKKRKKFDLPKADIRRFASLLPSLLLSISAAVVAFMTAAPLLPVKLAITEKSYDTVFGIAGLVILLLSTAYFSLKDPPRKTKMLVVLVSLALGIVTLLLPAFAPYPFYTRTALAVCVVCLAASILGLMFGLDKLEGSGRRLAVFLIHLSMIILAFGFVGTRGMNTETSRVVQINDTVGIGKYNVTLQSLTVDDGSLIKTWTAGLALTDGGNDRNAEASLRFYKQKDIYHSKALIISSLKEDLYIIVENAADDGTVLLKLSVLKWVSLLWVGAALMLASSAVLCRKGICGDTYRKI